MRTTRSGESALLLLDVIDLLADQNIEYLLMSATKAYLDTCIVSGLAKGDLPQAEVDALLTILQARRNGQVELVASPVVGKEIADIPERFRTPHSAILTLLNEIALIPAFRVTPPFGPRDFPHGIRPDQLFMLLGNILEATDAAHVYQAAKHGVRYVITVDDRTMLRRSAEVEKLCGVKLVRPSEFVHAVLGGP